MSLFKKCENTSILARLILRRDRVRTLYGLFPLYRSQL